MVLPLDLIDGVGELPPKRLVLVALDSNRGGLDVTMVCPSGTLYLDLPSIFVVDDALALVHGLVEHIDFVFIAERRANFLLYHSDHSAGDLISQRIQKFHLRFNLFF